MIRSARKLKGVTLIELLIAVALLGVIVGPIMISIQSMVGSNVALRDRTIAIYTAQLRMEELIDLNAAELSAEVARSTDAADYNGFLVSVATSNLEEEGGTALPADLTRAIVTVFSADGRQLFSMENIIFVGAAPVGGTP